MLCVAILRELCAGSIMGVREGSVSAPTITPPLRIAVLSSLQVICPDIRQLGIPPSYRSNAHCKIRIG